MSNPPSASQLASDEFAIYIDTKRANAPIPIRLILAFLESIAATVLEAPKIPNGTEIELIEFSQGSITARYRIFLADPAGQLSLVSAAISAVALALQSGSGPSTFATQIVVNGDANTIMLVSRDSDPISIERRQMPKVEQLEQWRAAGREGLPWEERGDTKLLARKGASSTYVQSRAPAIADGTLLAISKIVHVVPDPVQNPAAPTGLDATTGFFFRAPSGRISFIEDVGFGYSARLYPLDPTSALAEEYLNRKVRIHLRHGVLSNDQFSKQFSHFAEIDTIEFIN